MAIIDMKDYGPSAKLYWWTVTALGCLAFAAGVTGVSAHGAGADGCRC